MKFQQWRSLVVLLFLLALAGLIGYAIEFEFPTRAPLLSNTYTPLTQPTPQEIGAYDVLGFAIDRAAAEQLAQTETGRVQLAPENGAVEITQELIDLGRDAFYRETFGNEYFFSDVAGAINGPINLLTMGKAIAALGGKPTANLQISLDRQVSIGGRTFAAGTLLNTGLDVPAGALVPLGMQLHKSGGKIRVGLTCALCHATIDPDTGRILEGAPNIDVDTGLLQAFATNSAALFRQTGVDPTRIAAGNHAYITAAGQPALLPDAQTLEAAVDAQLLAWSPGNFDSSPDNYNNPAQIPSSYTFDSYPYGWSGFSSIGWFHGLTTLNNNVHATNSDPTTGAHASFELLGIDKETYLGAILQQAANPQFRLPAGAKPSEFFEKVDPTPGTPAINQVIKMPGYPKGSRFVLDGLMASSPGYPVAAQINGMSAYQNTLAPPPRPDPIDRDSLQRGAALFEQANCAQCHSGRYFTNHQVIPRAQINTQPSRAVALAKLPQTFVPPQTYPANVPVPLPVDPPVLPVPGDIAPDLVQALAYAIDGSGGYKVPNLIGLAVTAPYLHDGGAAAGPEALKPDSDGNYRVADRNQLGLAGTLLQWIRPDPEASLRVLLDRRLRAAAIEANRADPDLQATNVDGSGHAYWVDQQAGFTAQDQTDLVQFLLSIDDDPAVIPASAASATAEAAPSHR